MAVNASGSSSGGGSDLIMETYNWIMVDLRYTVINIFG
jgi:hypothetical protein